MHKLYKAIINSEIIDLSSKYFSRKLLYALFDKGAFDSAYNGFSGHRDYKFMLDMFNKRNKSQITSSQQKKINAIIAFSIKPYLKKNLKFKNG